MGSFLDLPHTKVQHFLERLEKSGITDQFVTRFRNDDEFSERLGKLLMGEFLENPGPRLTIEVDRTKSRAQLHARLVEEFSSVLKLEIIEKLEPKTIFPDAGQTFVPGTEPPTEKMDVYVVPLFRELKERQAVTVLAEIGLESVQTEEALTFALQHGYEFFSRDYCIITLAANCMWPEAGMEFGKMLTKPQKNFLDFGVTIAGFRQISLWGSDMPFSSRMRYLVKKKKTKPSAKPE